MQSVRERKRRVVNGQEMGQEEVPPEVSLAGAPVTQGGSTSSSDGDGRTGG